MVRLAGQRAQGSAGLPAQSWDYIHIIPHVGFSFKPGFWRSRFRSSWLLLVPSWLSYVPNPALDSMTLEAKWMSTTECEIQLVCCLLFPPLSTTLCTPVMAQLFTMAPDLSNPDMEKGPAPTDSSVCEAGTVAVHIASQFTGWVWRRSLSSLCSLSLNF